MHSTLHKALFPFIVTGMLLSACGRDLWGSNDLYQTPTQTSQALASDNPESTPTNLFLPDSITSTPEPNRFPTTTPWVETGSGTPRPTLVYLSQSGDNLTAVALRFGVEVSEITSSGTLPATGLINPKTPLVMPNRLSQVPSSPSQQIIPDSELVYSPSGVGFDIEGYITSAGGKMSTLREPMGNDIISGAEGIQRMAFGSSISPRILLAIIQYHTGWVQGLPEPSVNENYPLGYPDPGYPGLYQQLRLVVRELLAGYFGWRDGELTELNFPDGSTLRIAPSLNPGTVAIQYMFSKHLNQTEWLEAIDQETGFPALFASMFGNPFERAIETGYLFPPDLTQPTFFLPFEVGALWSLTSGPHPAWEQESALAALDFAPAMNKSGCGESFAWVLAVAPGQIVRSETGYVVLDVDPDGNEQTGWVVLYQHIATKDRIASGSWVNAGDKIGHPSCEGGMATGTHTHIARKYNGEWVAAGDPLPFVMSGWTAHAGSQARQGTLTKGELTITASMVGSHESQITRKPDE